jgi:hypothetical protein
MEPGGLVLIGRLIPMGIPRYFLICLVVSLLGIIVLVVYTKVWCVGQMTQVLIFWGTKDSSHAYR